MTWNGAAASEFPRRSPEQQTETATQTKNTLPSKHCDMHVSAEAKQSKTGDADSEAAGRVEVAALHDHINFQPQIATKLTAPKRW